MSLLTPATYSIFPDVKEAAWRQAACTMVLAHSSRARPRSDAMCSMAYLCTLMPRPSLTTPTRAARGAVPAADHRGTAAPQAQSRHAITRNRRVPTRLIADLSPSPIVDFILENGWPSGDLKLVGTDTDFELLWQKHHPPDTMLPPKSKSKA